MSEWISIEKELPQQGHYLLALADGSMAVGYLDSWNEWCPAGVYATYDGCGTVALDAKPTHWMKLPLLPVVEDQP
ncbi:DUF551 domain-containing protein [Pseudomonas mohnii]